MGAIHRLYMGAIYLEGSLTHGGAGSRPKVVAKLCDFGEAVSMETAALMEDRGDAFHGTGTWAAPEALRHPRIYSQAGDVHALALVVYECMSRQRLGSQYTRVRFGELTMVDPSRKYFDFMNFILRGGAQTLPPRWR